MFKSDEPCRACGEVYWIQNTNRHWCASCVFKYNHNGISKSEYYQMRNNMQTLQKSTALEKRMELLRKDREWYRYQFDTKLNVCEECGCELPSVFEDNDDNIVMICQYSHILSKGAYPEFRHHKFNCNRLCKVHHDMWEFASEEEKKRMYIWESNQDSIFLMKHDPNNTI